MVLKSKGMNMKVLFGYLEHELRGGSKFQIEFTSNFQKIEVGFLTSNQIIKYKEVAESIGKINIVPPTRQFFKRLSRLKCLAKEYDVIYLNKAVLNLPELFLVKMAGFDKVIFHAHSVGKDCDNKFVKKMYTLLHYITRPFIGAVTDKMYACSKEAGVWLFGHRFEEKGEIINNGIDVEKFKFNLNVRNLMRNELGIKGFCIVHIGAFSAIKNQTYLVSAFNHFHKDVPNSVLVFAGTGEYLNQVITQVKKLHLEKDVIFLGQRNDISKVIQVADVFVLPSLLEGLPFVAIEAQAAGVPCIITNAASKQVRLTDRCEFYDINNSEEELSKAIKRKMGESRIDTSEEIKHAGFDIKQCALSLEKELIDLCMGSE